MGGTMLHVLHRALNPALQTRGLSPLNIRIGADYGEATISELAVPLTGFAAKEVASDALNRAVKIEEACNPNEFRIGRALYELIHVQWLERASEVPFDGAQVGIPGYQAYRMM
jgi:class 3 adenylate cyclase